MNEMIERVARVIAEEINGGKFDDARWYNNDQREVHRRRARAAIQAMRTPTAEMLNFGVGNKEAKLTWELMIDAVLQRA